MDALFAQSGVIRADTIDEMFDIASCLDLQPLPPGRRVAILTNAGGPGILAADACEASGLVLAQFSAETHGTLAAALPAMASVGNPIDMIASAGPERCARGGSCADDRPRSTRPIVLFARRSHPAPAIMNRSRRRRRLDRRDETPVLSCVMAEPGRPAPPTPTANGCPAFAFPENAALGRIVGLRQWRAQPRALLGIRRHRRHRGAVCRAAERGAG